ncbi:MAG TPA: ribosome biogenesis factor YjgA [Steroidobacteraceae bacterium]|jgi:ribosome-associated protein
MRFSRSDPEPPDEGPSKSLRKREAHAAQALGEQLVALKDADLVALGLPEPLYEAIVAARSIGSRGGAARQRQYIGKLMRDIDLAPVREALSAKAARSALEAQRFHRAETWRTRLMASGPAALAALREAFPALDEGDWRKRVEAARTEREHAGTGGAASRELFRALRQLLD